VISAWLQAKQWAQNSGDADKTREVAVAAIDSWQIYYYRGNAWVNALSSANAQSNTNAAPSAQPPALPDAVRLVLTLSAGQALVGNITRDWIRQTL
jgi:general secretion pathway protein J